MSYDAPKGWEDVLRSQFVILHLYANGNLVELIVQTKAIIQSARWNEYGAAVVLTDWQIIITLTWITWTRQNVLHCEYKTGRRMTWTGISVDAEVNGLQLHGAFCGKFCPSKNTSLDGMAFKGAPVTTSQGATRFFFFKKQMSRGAASCPKIFRLSDWRGLGSNLPLSELALPAETLVLTQNSLPGWRYFMANVYTLCWDICCVLLSRPLLWSRFSSFLSESLTVH